MAIIGNTTATPLVVDDKNLTNVTDQGLLNITNRNFVSNKTQPVDYTRVIIDDFLVGGVVTDFEFRDYNTNEIYTYLEEKDKILWYDLCFYNPADSSSINFVRIGDVITSDMVGWELITDNINSPVKGEDVDYDYAAHSITIKKEMPIQDKIATETYVNKSIDDQAEYVHELFVLKASFVYDEETQTLNINI